jgi:hypothetical protein
MSSSLRSRWVTKRTRPPTAPAKTQNPRRRQDPRLPQAPAQELAVAPGLGLEVLGQEEEASHRGPQALGEGDHEGGEAPGHLLGLHAQEGGGVEEPGPVQVGGEAMGLGQGLDRLLHLQGHHPAPRQVVGVLQGDEARGGLEGAPADGPLKGLQVRHPARGGHGPDQGPGQEGGGPKLVLVEVGPLRGQDLVSPGQVEEEGHLVGHGAGGEEEGPLKAQ